MKTLFFLMGAFVLPVLGAELKVGDRVSVTLRGVPAEDAAKVTGDYVINERGEVRPPLLEGGVRSVGLTALQLAERIEAAYRNEGIYQKPRVEVVAAKAEEPGGARISVGGRVRNSGPVPFRGGLTVLQAIDAAGGRDEFGGRNVFLIRGGRQYCLDFKQLAHLNIVVEPDDSLRVDQKGIIDRWKGTPERVDELMK